MGGDVKPIYVLYGDEPFLRDLHRREIIARAIGEADPQLCVASFDATAELPEVLDELRTTPFLAPRRIVVVRDADPFVSTHRKSLEGYLNSPAPGGVLILMLSSFQKRERLYKVVRKIGEVVDCSVPNETGLLRWVGEVGSKCGKKISRDAAELLLQWIGADLGALNAEVEKLSSYVGERKSITPEDVFAVAAASAGPAAYALTNAITAADVPAALRALDGMLTARGDEFKALGSIAWHLRRAVGAKQLLQSGKQTDQALPRMPLHQKTPFLNMLKRRSMGSLREDFRRLIQADLAMKTGTDPKAAMQRLVVGLCR
jgi:DNA polymerase-3 subunit delta